MNKSIYSKLGICPAKAGTVCGCGRCKKIIFALASKAGIHPAAFVDGLGLAPARNSASARQIKPVKKNRVAETMTVSTRGGNQSFGAEALVKALTILSERGLRM